MTAIQKAILQALRHGPLNQYEIAEATGEPPFRVRAELRNLRRSRIVFDRLQPNRGHIWMLTDLGYGLVWEEAQQELFR